LLLSFSIFQSQSWSCQTNHSSKTQAKSITTSIPPRYNRVVATTAKNNDFVCHTNAFFIFFKSSHSSNAVVIFVEEKLHVDRRRFCARLLVIVKSSASSEATTTTGQNIWNRLKLTECSNGRLLEKKLGGKLQHRKHRFEQKCINSFAPKYKSYFFQGRIPSR
jgi:hypothetical protein